MIFDYKNNKEEALKNGITETFILDTTFVAMKSMDGRVQNHTFRNFERLEFEDGARIENCIFEDCDSIVVNECTLSNCTFNNFEMLWATDSSFTDSTFCNSKCDDNYLIEMIDSTISHCEFDDIELRGQSLLCEGLGNNMVKYCKFSNIRTSRPDGCLMFGERKEGKVFKKKVHVPMLDEATCHGLDTITDTRGRLLPAMEGVRRG